MSVGAQVLQASVGHALTLERHTGRTVPSADTLGLLVYGGPGSDVPAPLLQPEPAYDVLRVDTPVRRGCSGRIRWAAAGPWLYGALDCDAWDGRRSVAAAALTDAAEAVYRELLAFLQTTGTPHLLRLWNYLPNINREDGGLERYRHFNVGRQRALLGSRCSAFDGAPAACALGTYEGPFRLRFLAGATPALPIENPRQVSAYHYPSAYGPASPSFSRAALLDAGAGQLALLVSGTASIVGHTTVHTGDWRAQLDETLRNLDAVFAAARERCTAPLRLADSHCVIYLRDPALAPAVKAAFDAAVGVHSCAARTAVLLQADVCRSDLLLEIETHAWASGTVLAGAPHPKTEGTAA